MAKSLKNPNFKGIPVTLTLEEFNQFILPHLSQCTRGPKTIISLYQFFSYILKVLYTGMQWHMLTIDDDENGQTEIHYTRVFRKFNQWANDGSIEKIFDGSVFVLALDNKLDLSVLHLAATGITLALDPAALRVSFPFASSGSAAIG